jgi:hypothetical protein
VGVLMKRSEMVELLQELINSNLAQEYIFPTEKISDILSELEKVGMLPPVSKLKMLNILDNAWEPEDK